MTVDTAVEIMRNGLFLVLKIAAPPLIVSLLIGLIVSIFQTVTSIQEQTLTFVPKVVGIFVTLMFIGNWMLNEMATFAQDLWQNFAVYIR
ncbi:MAG: flagellar biosynthesis protein FliQ [Lachnospiraceae bacterium]|nr:flagellar biosynthesis protein FliQ [Lachnospiraceae bacterium]